MAKEGTRSDLYPISATKKLMTGCSSDPTPENETVGKLGLWVRGCGSLDPPACAPLVAYAPEEVLRIGPPCIAREFASTYDLSTNAENFVRTQKRMPIPFARHLGNARMVGPGAATDRPVA